jgi:hypothetical protein
MSQSIPWCGTDIQNIATEDSEVLRQQRHMLHCNSTLVHLVAMHAEMKELEISHGC